MKISHKLQYARWTQKYFGRHQRDGPRNGQTSFHIKPFAESLIDGEYKKQASTLY